MRTVGTLASFSVSQEAALSVCDGRRQAVVDLIDNAQPKPWWEKLKFWERSGV